MPELDFKYRCESRYSTITVNVLQLRVFIIVRYVFLLRDCPVELKYMIVLLNLYGVIFLEWLRLPEKY